MGHIRNHLALARKINNFLGSGPGKSEAVTAHTAKLEQWLGILEAQVSASMPRPYKVDAPDINVTWNWVEAFCEEMVDQLAYDMETHGCIIHSTAIQTQQAIIAAMVSGCYCPPPRIHVIKTMLHPDFEGGCQDPDCTRSGGSCRGNHLDLGPLPPPPEDEEHTWPYFDYLTTEVSNIVVHHKNDRWVGWMVGP